MIIAIFKYNTLKYHPLLCICFLQTRSNDLLSNKYIVRSYMLVAVLYKQLDLDLIDQLNLFTDIFE